MIVELFPVKIYQNKIENAKLILDNILPDIRNMLDNENAVHEDLGPKSYSTFNSNNQLQKHPAMSTVVSQLNVMIAECWKDFQLHTSLQPYINEMWINETYPQGAGVTYHNHSPYLLAGVCYLQADPGMGNLIFENPNSLVIGTQPHNWNNLDSISGNIQAEFPVNTGDVVMFPGWLKHRAGLNITNSNRYIIGFNVGCRGKFPISSYINHG
jgi:uncharacterized protein (TIGR02466 family)